jgi:hypothetical protein
MSSSHALRGPNPLAWLLAHALAFIPPGLVIALRWESWSAARGPLPLLATDAALRPALVVSAVLLGLAQGHLLRPVLPGWGRATLDGTALGLVVAATVEVLNPNQRSAFPPWWPELAAVWLPFLGLGAGLGQRRLLRRYVPGADQWLVYSLISWLFCLPLGLLANSLVMAPLTRDVLDWRPSPGASTVLMAVVVGVVLGSMLFFFLSQLLPRSAAPRSPAAGQPVHSRAAAPRESPDDDTPLP